MKKEKGITVIALIITIILMLILAGVALNVIIGENGLFKISKKAGEDYKIASIKEKIEQEIIALQTEKIVNDEKLTVEQALVEIWQKEVFSEIDLAEEIGIVEGYVIKLGYDTWNNVIIEGIEKDIGVRLICIINPKGYTNGKVEILLNTNNDNISISNIEIPDEMSKKTNNVYEVEKNGMYIVKVTLSNGKVLEKEIKISTIDKLPPKDFEISYDYIDSGFKINANTQDAESTTENVCSAIDRYEYYIKFPNEINFKKYTTSEIPTYHVGKYEIYVIAYDKAGNSRKSNSIVFTEEWERIYLEEDLINMANNLNGNYKLMSDIELTNSWIPIGSTYSTSFNGIFDGNMHKITNLLVININGQTTNDFKGLFGATSTNSKICNLIIENANINSIAHAGILVGYSQGNIENVSVSGTITGHQQVRWISRLSGGWKH